MTPSAKCVEIIKSFEGFSFKAYKDPGSVNGLPITIGWGSTAYVDGKPIIMGDVVTMLQAEEILKKEVYKTGKAVFILGVPFNQNQFDAVVSFAYNVGLSALRNSTLLRKARANVNDLTIRNEFAKWVKNDGRIMNGLVRRRKIESDLYFK